MIKHQLDKPYLTPVSGSLSICLEGISWALYHLLAVFTHVQTETSQNAPVNSLHALRYLITELKYSSLSDLLIRFLHFTPV